MTILAMFGEANIMGIVLEEEDHMKLKYLIEAMIASRSSRKSPMQHC